MDARLQEMLDHYEITKTLSEYCFGCDRGDVIRMASVYADESWDNHGVHAAPGREFARSMSKAIADTTDVLYHLLGQTQVSVDGDHAGAVTYFFAAAHSKAEDGALMCHQLGGRFVDKLVREDGRWLIKKRDVVRDWSASFPVEADWTAGQGLIDGERSGADPAYEALGRRQPAGADRNMHA